jgi:hypothetical protein
MKRSSRALPVLLALAAGPLAAQDYYGDIRPIIERKCLTCHSESGVSFSFEDAELTYGMRAAIVSAIRGRRMPPWLAEPGHQQYLFDLSFSDEQRQLVDAWADRGFPKGNRSESSAAPAATSRRFETDLTLEVIPGQAYLPNQTRKDDYRCFVFDWPIEQSIYINGFRALPGNRSVAHHLVVFAAEPEVAERFKALDAAEPDLGYQCFGGPVPDRLGKTVEREAYERVHPDGVRELNDASFWLAHWAPGMEGYAFPNDTGILMRPGMVLIAQVHYYSAFAPGETDAGTKMQFRVSERVAKPALHFPLTSDRWLNAADNASMVIPPGERARFETSSDLETIAAYIAHHTKVPKERINALEVHSANLHMHSFGAAGVVSLTTPDGRKETLLSVPRWDLNWQRDFTFVQPKIAAREALARTRLSVECVYENHTDAPVVGGFGSDEEMCFNFSYISVVQHERTADEKPQTAAGAR